MRVVFLSAARQVWGAEVSLLTLAQGLTDAGVSQALVCPDSELADYASAAGIEHVHRVTPRSQTFTQGRMRESMRLWARCLRVVRPGDTLVIFSYYLLALLPFVRPVLRARGVHVALDLHDDLTSPKARAVVQAGSAAVDTVIACSRFTAAQLPRHRRISSLHRPVGAPTASLRAASDPESAAHPDHAPGLATAPSGPGPADLDPVARQRTQRSARAHQAHRARVPASDRAAQRYPAPAAAQTAPAADASTAPAADASPPRADHSRPLRVGVIGRITPEKRHELIIDALAQVRCPAQLVVRGGGDGFSDDLAPRVLAHGAQVLGDRFVDEGRVTHAQALAGLDVLVVGNPREPMGRTVLEAQDRGVVVVVPDSGGSQELVRHQETGLIYAHDDAADLARTIELVAADPEAAARMAQAARRAVPRPGPYAQEYLSRLIVGARSR